MRLTKVAVGPNIPRRCAPPPSKGEFRARALRAACCLHQKPSCGPQDISESTHIVLHNSPFEGGSRGMFFELISDTLSPKGEVCNTMSARCRSYCGRHRDLWLREQAQRSVRILIPPLKGVPRRGGGCSSSLPSIRSRIISVAAVTTVSIPPRSSSDGGRTPCTNRRVSHHFPISGPCGSRRPDAAQC